MSRFIITNLLTGRQEKTIKDSTRVELVACAARFFAEQGYYGTSTKSIAEFCNIRKASLFHHYKTKEEIALAAIQYVQNECQKYIFKYVKDAHQQPKQNIYNFFQAAEKFFNERVESLLPILLGLELHENVSFSQAVQNYLNVWQEALMNLLAPVCENVTIAHNEAQVILTHIQGHLITARIQKNPQKITHLFTELSNIWAV